VRLGVWGRYGAVHRATSGPVMPGSGGRSLKGLVYLVVSVFSMVHPKSVTGTGYDVRVRRNAPATPGALEGSQPALHLC
jgi:hypothetical protein